MAVAHRPPAHHRLLAAALGVVALLASTAPASAAPDRLAGGDAAIALSPAFRHGLAGKKVRLRAIEPAKLGRGRLAFAVRGGELDPTTGRGAISLGLGGLQLRRGRKAAAVRSLTIDTRRGEVSANVAGRKLKLASLGGWSETREGFGVDLAIRRLRLSGPAAARLNRRLGFGAFAGGQILGSALAEARPSAVSVLAGGGVSLTASEATLAKLTQVGVSVLPLAPTAKLDPLSPKPVFSSSISGGAIGPAANAGVLQTTGGLLLVQELGSLVSRVWIEEIKLDLGAGAVTAEVFGESNAETGPGQRPLDFGDVRRVSLATLAAAGAEVSSDPTARTIAVERAAATLQPVTAEILDDFVEVYERATKSGGKEKLNGGDPLGAVSFAIQTQ